MERHVEKQEPTGKKFLIIEATRKVLDGERMVREGNLELDNLLGEHSLKTKKTKKSGGGGKLTAGQKSAITKGKKLSGKEFPSAPPGKKLIKEREQSTFRMDKRTDETIMDKMVNLVRKNRQASNSLFKSKLHLSDRRLDRLLAALSKQGQLVDQSNGEDGRHKWVLAEASKAPAKEKESINGHKLAKTPGGGGGEKKKRGGPMIDVTAPAYVDKALKLMNSNDWVTNGTLMDVIDVSPGVVNRLTSHLKKEKLIKEVIKKHNPAYKHSPKNYEKPLRYWAVA